MECLAAGSQHTAARSSTHSRIRSTSVDLTPLCTGTDAVSTGTYIGGGEEMKQTRRVKRRGALIFILLFFLLVQE